VALIDEVLGVNAFGPEGIIVFSLGKDGKPEVAIPHISQETLAEMVAQLVRESTPS